jgi:hypothetical protein
VRRPRSSKDCRATGEKNKYLKSENVFLQFIDFIKIKEDEVEGVARQREMRNA